MIRILAIFLTLTLLLSCASARKTETRLSDEFAPSSDAPMSRMMAGSSLMGSIAPAQEMAESSTPGFPADPSRKITYSASLGLEVPNPIESRIAVEGMVQRHAGRIERSSLESITFRIAPEKLDTVLAEIESLGAILYRNVQGQDITTQYTDMALRLEVAEKSRARMMELIERAKETKDLIEAEREVRRLTEEIESMKGAIRSMDDQVSLATVSVEFRQAAIGISGGGRVGQGRFEWINRVGVDRALAPVSPYATLSGGGWFAGDKFHLAAPSGQHVPDGFVLLLRDGSDLVATSPEDARLVARAHSVRQKTDLAFWSTALEKELRDRGYLNLAAEDFAMDRSGLSARRIRSTSGYAGEEWTYDLWLVMREGDAESILTVEFVRRAKDSDANGAAVEAAVRGARMR